MPSMVAALMTPLIPGAGPPPTRIANLPRLIPLTISLGQQIVYQRSLFFQFVNRGVYLAATELINGQARDDFKSLSIAAYGKRTDEALLDAVAAIGTNTDAVPIIGRRGLKERAHAVHNCIGGAAGAGGAPRLDNGSAPL